MARTYSEIAAAPYPAKQPGKGSNEEAMIERQMALSGLRKREPTSDRDRGSCSPLGGQAVRSAPKKR